VSSLLWWDKPAPATTHAAHVKAHSADGAPPGTYAPNMSPADRQRWKAKRIRGTDPRIEVRKGLANGSLLLVVVRPDSITISTNFKAQFDDQGWEELCRVREEARATLATP